MLAPVVHILPLTTIQRDRLLPVPGFVRVRSDQKVNILDVIAEANYGGEHLLIDVARELGISSAAAQDLIQVKTGDFMNKGTVIASGGANIFHKTVRASREGRVILAGGGQVLMQGGDGIYPLRAGLPGIIKRIIPERGAEILFSGALVQGIWGNGRMNTGVMHPLLTAPGDSLTLNQLDISLRGSILLSGHCDDPAVLQTAQELPIRGIILGSMSPALIPPAMKVPYPIILVDGFGKLPLDAAAFKLLLTNARREISLNAEQLDLQTGIRPEILIPLPVTQPQSFPHEMDAFEPEQPVRMRRNPHAGEIGILLALRPGLTLMPSGLRVAAADVRLDNGEQITVPLANLEVLE